MRETILSNCERNFILKAASELKRLDGRKLEDFRDLKVLFGSDWGLCYVSLGETKVLTQVTCEIQEPKATKPNEGLLFINVELSSMASSNFEPGRASNLSIHINRLLEKCLKDSRAVDLESLCIVAEDKVWVLRVDVNILNHDGSLIDCASISALAAIAHFKRPDVTTNGEEITIHSIADRDPIPIILHHQPVCISFALLNNSENIFSDPTAIEERVSDASLTFGLNAYNEICCLHLGGNALINPKLILTCCRKASERSKKVAKIINTALQKDAEARQNKGTIGFVDEFTWDRITSLSDVKLQVQLSNFTLFNKELNIEAADSDMGNEYFQVTNLGNNCAELNIKSNSKAENNMNFTITSVQNHGKSNDNLFVMESIEPSYGEGGASKWDINPSEPGFSENSPTTCPEPDTKIKTQSSQISKIESIDLCDDDDEDEEVVVVNVLEPNDPRNKKSIKQKKTRLEKEKNTREKEPPAPSTTSSARKPKRKKRSKK